MVHQQDNNIINPISIDTDLQDKRIVLEFTHLLEKSKQLFNGLRDLPSYGHKQWQTYFGRAFDIYTKLWRFQQTNRLILDKYYNLKRWQIGEIASKIGQLYYHYYLRTSETNYLNEAFQFYGAIRARGYYTSKEGEDCSPELIVKKLRYLARFIVVCLLLKRIKNVKELVRELSSQIDDYVASYEPEDQLEWSIVLQEIKMFIECDSPVKILDASHIPLTLTHRLTQLSTPPLEKTPSMNLQLEEVVIMGNRCEQAKFSELTMDMFRLLQTLEREPADDNNSSGGAKRENPHKQMLFKPSIDSLMTYLTCSWKDVDNHGVMLLYLSCDEVKCHMEVAQGCKAQGFDIGGVATGKKTDCTTFPDRFSIESQCLYPGDLTTYTRKPFFLIVDADNSTIFQEVSSPFGSPFMVIMSPESVPERFDQIHPARGSLYTLFLHSPLSALCSVTNIETLPFGLWEIGLTYIDRFMAEASRLICCKNYHDDNVLQFFGDDFLRLLLLRHVFCSTVLGLHKSFQSKLYQPSSAPVTLTIDSDHLNRIIVDLANHLGVANQFLF